MYENHSSHESFDKHKILANGSDKCKKCNEYLATHPGENPKYCYFCYKQQG